MKKWSEIRDFIDEYSFSMMILIILIMLYFFGEIDSILGNHTGNRHDTIRTRFLEA